MIPARLGLVTGVTWRVDTDLTRRRHDGEGTGDDDVNGKNENDSDEW